MAYWITCLALIWVGLIGALSIGPPFFLLGLAMLVLGPFRRRPRVFGPCLMAVVAFDISFWAAAPLSCTATSDLEGPSTTMCTSVLSTLRLGELASPAYGSPLLFAIVVAVAALVVTLGAVVWRARAR